MNTEIKNKRIPKLRFPEFDEEWCSDEFSNLVEKINDKFDPSKENYNLPCIELENISQKTGILLSVFESKKQSSIKNKFYKDDILFGKLRPYLRKFLRANFDGVCSSEIWVFRGRNIINKFVYFLIQTEKFNSISNVTFGSKMPRSDWNYVSTVPFNFPQKKEQQKIASFLSVVDEKIEQLKNKKDALEKYKKGMMQKIFPKQGETVPEIRFGGFSGEWEEKKLGEIGKFISGQGFSQLEQGGHNGIPFYKVSDMNLLGNEKKIKASNNYVTKNQIKRNKFKVIKKPSIIFAKVGAAIFLERKRIAENFIIDNNMMSFIPFEDLMFMKYIFETTRLSKFAQVGALPSYNASDLSIIKITIPDREEQQKIASFLTALDDKIDNISKKLIQAEDFKKGLLQGLFV